ncbi:MAG: hypothetical protein AAGD13_19100 [Pseudomonadota bacterium]
MTRWRITSNENCVTLHAELYAPIFNVAVERTLPTPMPFKGLRRLAHQIRQDVWRVCRSTRGFVPVVQVSTDRQQTVIRAGGTLLTRSGHRANLAEQIARVLDRAENRARWIAHARRAGDGEGHVRQDPDRKSG